MPLWDLLVCVKDKVHETDPDLNAIIFPKRGDVVAVLPAGTHHGRQAHHHPDWRVVRVDLPEAEATALTTREPGDRDRNPLLRDRGFYLDLDALPDCHRLHLTPRWDHCTNSLGVLEMDAEHLRAVRRRKEPLPSPHVIGPSSSNVIG